MDLRDEDWDMTSAETVQRLIFHSGPDEGVPGVLRPYRGVRQDVLADVLFALRACAPEIGSDVLPSESQ